MAKTKEQKALYCREWRIKNRERYLAKKKDCYWKNKNQYREEAKGRARKRYYEVVLPRRRANPELYKLLDRQHSIKRKEVKKRHLRELREKLGGMCVHCGYKEDVDILQFHHHSKNKEDNVSNLQNYKKREAEARKCVLLCPNCHALTHFRR